MNIRKKLIIFFTSLLSCLFIGVAIDLACGPEPDPYDYYISFFHNNIQKNDGYKPFYFNGYTFLNGYIYEAERDNKIAEGNINVKEWVAYCGGRTTYKDIAHVLYELDKKTDSLYFRSYQKGKTVMPDSLKNNSFVKYLLARQKKMSYLVLAKKSEPLVNTSYDDKWNVIRPSKNQRHDLALQCVKMGLSLNDSFLRLRCFYQAQRLLHYGRYFKEASDMYDKHIKTVHSGSHVLGWALALKAGEEEQFDHRARAAYLYSKLFAGYPERRVRAYYDFLTTKVPVENVTKLAKNNNEKATIYAIKGMHNAHIGLAALRQIYKTYPKSEFVSILLVREINKIEEGYLTPKINGSEYYGSIGYDDHAKYDSVKRSFIKYIPRLKAFCNRIASERKYTEPELGYLASAYLSWIQKDPSSGFRALAQINNKNLRTKLSDQKQLINLLLLSQSIKKMDEQAENNLLPSLNWLDKKVANERSIKLDEDKYQSYYDLRYYTTSSRDFYAKVLAPIYFKQKDTAMAALCILKSEKTMLTQTIWAGMSQNGLGFDMPNFWQNNLHSYHLKKIIKWEEGSGKRPYLKLLMKAIDQPQIKNVFSVDNMPGKGYVVNKSSSKPELTTMAGIYDLLGTAFLREHKFAAAAKAFKHIDITKLDLSTSDAYNDSLSNHYNQYVNPFVDNLRDYPHIYSLKKTEGYNKLVYAKTMAELERQIRTDPKHTAQAWYKMACGLYNTSYVGSAWYYTAYYRASEDIYRTKGFYYDSDYLRTRTAETWFLTARKLSNDAEFKARCTFMAAKCRQNQIAVPESWGEKLEAKKMGYEFKGNDHGYGKAITHNSYFAGLKNNYSKTKFYQLAINECSYFRDFLAPKKMAKEKTK